MLIITHNLGVVARYADRVNVMYAGPHHRARHAPRELYANPRHPYTLGLLRSVPRLDEPRREQPRPDPRPAARPDAPAAGLRLRAALRVRVERCRAERRRSTPSATTHLAACWLATDSGG